MRAASEKPPTLYDSLLAARPHVATSQQHEGLAPPNRGSGNALFQQLLDARPPPVAAAHRGPNNCESVGLASSGITPELRLLCSALHQGDGGRSLWADTPSVPLTAASASLTPASLQQLLDFRPPERNAAVDGRTSPNKRLAERPPTDSSPTHTDDETLSRTSSLSRAVSRKAKPRKKKHVSFDRPLDMPPPPLPRSAHGPGEPTSTAPEPELHKRHAKSPSAAQQVPRAARRAAGKLDGKPRPSPPPPPPLPPPCTFDERECPLPLPSRSALDVLGRATMAQWRHASEAASASDSAARHVIAAVHAAARELWPSARVSPFGSRATGLAVGASDVDLVIEGVPGMTTAREGGSGCAHGAGSASVEPRRDAAASHKQGEGEGEGEGSRRGRGAKPFEGGLFGMQLEALHALLPRVRELPHVAHAEIKKAPIPVITLTVDLPAAHAYPVGADDGGDHGGTLNADGGAGSECGEGTTGTTGDTADTADASSCGGSPMPSTRLNIDLSIATPRHRGLRAAQYVRWLHSQLPHLAPLVSVLKALMLKHAVHSAYTGGLCSYALVLMTSRFLLDRPMLQYSMSPASQPVHVQPTSLSDVGSSSSSSSPASTPRTGGSSAGGAAPPAAPNAPPSVGQLLFELLAFYGSVFDPARDAVLGGVDGHGVPPPGCGFVRRAALPPLLAHAAPHARAERPPASSCMDGPFVGEPLVCIDPVDVANNTAKACYRVGQVQQLLRAAAKAIAASAEDEAKAEAAAAAAGRAPPRAACVQAVLERPLAALLADA
jgi:hypothetical protein